MSCETDTPARGVLARRPPFCQWPDDFLTKMAIGEVAKDFYVPALSPEERE